MATFVTHPPFDAMVEGPLGVAFFWPLDNTRYLLQWRPFIDVPIQTSVVCGAMFWRAVLVECQVSVSCSSCPSCLPACGSGRAGAARLRQAA